MSKFVLSSVKDSGALFVHPPPFLSFPVRAAQLDGTFFAFHGCLVRSFFRAVTVDALHFFS